MKTVPNSKYKILTESGFKNFHGVGVTSNTATIKLYFENGDYLQCTPDHKIKTSKGYIPAGELRVLETRVITDTKRGTRLLYKEDGGEVPVYDILEVEDVHSFKTGTLFVKNCLLLDEFGHVPTHLADAFFTSTFPTISSGKTTKVIMVSTPNGMNLFHKFWVDANAKPPRNDFKPIFVHWTDIPGRDEAWKATEIRNIGGPERFAQEYDCVTGDTKITVRNVSTGEVTFINIRDLYETLNSPSNLASS